MLKKLSKKIQKFLGLTSYVSELDQRLIYWRGLNPAHSWSQRVEKEKHQRIHRLRDVPSSEELKDHSAQIWDRF